MKPNTGAAAALKAIEEHEEKCRKDVQDAEAVWREAKSLAVEGDDVSERKERRLHREYTEALEMWHDATKKLAVFDKGVSQERREGEKIPLDEAKEIYAQLLLTVNLALESCVNMDAQSAALCDSPEAFHKAHADNWRSAKEGAIAAAVGDGVLPKWIVNL